MMKPGNFFLFKSCIRETLALLTCADGSTNAKNIWKILEKKK